MNNGNITNALTRKGYKILPYRLALVTKAVGRVIDVICDAKLTMFSAEEALMILDIARDVVERGMLDGDHA